ncbi:MAG: hypothetical protein FWD73_10135 [Polyangiaceae bacterium]|nr:hypothetical protein [Polyangiaceae bacterium]
MSGIPIPPHSLSDLVGRYGGSVHGSSSASLVERIAPAKYAGAGDLTPLFSARYLGEAHAAVARGAQLLVTEKLSTRSEITQATKWLHSHAAWALAELLDLGNAPETPPVIGEGSFLAQGAVVLSRVRIGSRVTIGAGAVIGAPGFGFVASPHGIMRQVPQLGGVVIEDDVYIGPLTTIAAGTIGPTIVRRGVKLDAHVHVGHNCEIGQGTIIAAQTGIAGSVHIGRGVLMGGQVGVADHLCIGDGARIAAKSGVIGDVPAGATVAGYPAVERLRWLRGLAKLYRRTPRMPRSENAA